jgi:predicted SAM-dependent methyltransferase
MLKMLNLGCGAKCHPAWINLDFVAFGPGVLTCDLREPLPFADASFDVVYHSHVLEHFTPEEAENFTGEAVRVLKPGGWMRIAVPDLESITSLYLQNLQAAAAGDRRAAQDYHWSVLELLDQMVRERPGGQMAKYLKTPDLPNARFVRSRIGAQYDSITAVHPPASLAQRIVRKGVRGLASYARDRLTRRVIRIIGGRRASARYELGSFRDIGDVHKWMYDRYSLRLLLQRHDICLVQGMDAFTSGIPDFSVYGLDVVDGEPRKPDSIYVEGVKIE